ncbi:MAG: DUF3795 domain-containing protein [bacterium]
MSINVILEPSLIAPCGMNCGLCLGYQRTKNHCAGCNLIDINSSHKVKCIIKFCEHLNTNNLSFCFECIKFPCRRLKDLDKRYRTKYGMSMMENLDTIKSIGVQEFVVRENKKWTCNNCGNIICVHRDNCLVCGTPKSKSQPN